MSLHMCTATCVAYSAEGGPGLHRYGALATMAGVALKGTLRTTRARREIIPWSRARKLESECKFNVMMASGLYVMMASGLFCVDFYSSLGLDRNVGYYQKMSLGPSI